MPLPKGASASQYIDHFVASKNKRFEGKSKKDRIKMALGAFYRAHPKKRTHTIKEDAVPVNNVSGGNVAGLDNNPGVNKINKKKSRRLRDIISSAKLK